MLDFGAHDSRDAYSSTAKRLGLDATSDYSYSIDRRYWLLLIRLSAASAFLRASLT